MSKEIDGMIAGSGLDNDANLYGPIQGMVLPPPPMMKQRKRKAYLIQPLSKVLSEKDIAGAKQGGYYVEGDPNTVNEDGDIVSADGHAVRELDLTVTGWSRSQSFEKNQQTICYSPDATTGRPSDIGKAAPYAILEGQACATCRWRFKKTAVDPQTNGFCSLVRGVKGVVESPDEGPVEVNLAFKNTAGPVGDAIHAGFTKHTDKDGVFTPFKVKLGSEKPAKASYFVPKILSIE